MTERYRLISELILRANDMKVLLIRQMLSLSLF
jgi:hypothetical protein